MKKIEFHKRFSNLDYLFLFSFIVSFLIILTRAVQVPFAHDEVATFFYFIQPGSFIPFFSHPDANGHFLNSFLSWICFRLFGDSEISLRLPNVISFLVYCFAIRKFANSLNSLTSKILLLCFFIFCFPLLNFFSLCRGYAISMAFFLLGLYYLISYFKKSSFQSLFFAFLFFQVALSAGLTLLIPVIVLGFLTFIFQLNRKCFFTFKNILLFLTCISLSVYWAFFGFYLQKNGALYYGAGESYWQVTFVSLIEMLLGKSLWMKVLLLVCFILIGIHFANKILKIKSLDFFESSYQFLFLVFILLLFAFYFLKLLFNVNYPEDRTGLFFYFLFILGLIFFVEEYALDKKILSLPFVLFFSFQFVSELNITHHSWSFYETMPKRFFSKLLVEQGNQKEKISVGGHRVIELFYSYLNYRSENKLNPILPPEKMQMNCDYYITWKKDQPFYDKFYEELDKDKNSELVLLKRKKKIKRNLVYELRKRILIQGNQEFVNLLEVNDTVFHSQNPILAEVELEVLHSSTPPQSWLVLQVDSVAGGSNYYFRRTPLNWLRFDWNGIGKFTTCLQTDSIQLVKSRLVLFLWNLSKNPLKIVVHKVRLYSLEAPGITLVSKSPD